MENQIEVYAIAIMAEEARDKVKKLKEIGKRTGYVPKPAYIPEPKKGGVKDDAKNV